MLDAMPRRLQIEWAEYARLRPFDQKRADRRAAIIAAAIFNQHRTKKSDPRMELVDMMIDYEGERVEDEVQLSEEETVAHLMGWAQAINNPEAIPQGGGV